VQWDVSQMIPRAAPCSSVSFLVDLVMIIRLFY
jgi:hypothetical protein